MGSEALQSCKYLWHTLNGLLTSFQLMQAASCTVWLPSLHTTDLSLSIVTVRSRHSGKLCVIFLTSSTVGKISPITPASSFEKLWAVSFVSQLGHQKSFREDELASWLDIRSFKRQLCWCKEQPQCGWIISYMVETMSFVMKAEIDRLWLLMGTHQFLQHITTVVLISSSYPLPLNNFRPSLHCSTPF